VGQIVSIGYEFENSELTPLNRIGNVLYTINNSQLAPVQCQGCHCQMVLTDDTLDVNKTSDLDTLGNYLMDNRDAKIYTGKYNEPMTVYIAGHASTGAQLLTHTEFHLTYTHCLPATNLIQETFKQTVSNIKSFMDTFHLVNGYVSKNKTTATHNITLLMRDQRGDTDNAFLVPSRITSLDELNFTPQMTIGVRLDNVFNVVRYISEGVVSDTEKMLRIYHMVNSLGPISDRAKGWVFLVLLNILPVSIHKRPHYTVRHPLKTIYESLNPEDQLTTSEAVGLLLEKFGNDRVDNQYLTIGGLINSIIYQEIDPSTNSHPKLYPYVNDVVLIEVRMFRELLGRLKESKGLDLTPHARGSLPYYKKLSEICVW
jgi:hypothetical protein